jgi:hypothetical protein
VHNFTLRLGGHAFAFLCDSPVDTGLPPPSHYDDHTMQAWVHHSHTRSPPPVVRTDMESGFVFSQLR